MNLFALISLSVTICCFILAFFVIIIGKSRLHRTWSAFNMVVGLWSLGIFFAAISKTPAQAATSWRFTYLPCTFISIVFYHLVYVFCDFKKEAKTFIFIYAQGIIFCLVIFFTRLFINSIKFVFNSVYYHQATITFVFWFTIWAIITFSVFYKLYNFIVKTEGIKRTQALYLFWGMALGFVGGTASILPSFGIMVYPALHFSICIYTLIITYAIFRYRIVDIKIVITRVGIFAFVYALVLGIPFLIGHTLKSWFFPTIVAVFLATLGPFIYIQLQHRAENILLRTQRQYQQALHDLSKSVTHIRNIEQLFDIITHQIVYSVKVSYAAMYLVDKENKKLTLKSEYHNHIVSSKSTLPKEISYSESFIPYLENIEKSLIVEEERLKLNHFFDLHVDIALVAPCFTKTGLTSIIFLGNKPNNQLYTEDDILTFDTLANQTSLAIENCFFLEELKRTERLKAVGTLAAGMAHEIKNPLTGIKTFTEYLPAKHNEPGFIDKFHKIVSLEVDKINSIVQQLLDFSKPKPLQLQKIDIHQIVDQTISLLSNNFIKYKIKLVRNYDTSPPPVHIDINQMQQVFCNLFLNAIEAMKNGGELSVVTKTKPDHIEITISDTGKGIAKKDIEHIFDPFYTTKETGTGLGMSIIYGIIKEHKGEIMVESEDGKGTMVSIKIPIN